MKFWILCSACQLPVYRLSAEVETQAGNSSAGRKSPIFGAQVAPTSRRSHRGGTQVEVQGQGLGNRYRQQGTWNWRHETGKWRTKIGNRN